MFFSFITVLSWLGRRPIGDWSATSRGPVPDRSATSLHQVAKRSPRGRRPVADQSATSPRLVVDQSPTSRRPTAKPCCDSSATSAIVLNFGRGEVAERLQCMSGLGLTERWSHPGGDHTNESSMTFIQSNGWTEIDLILKQKWRRFIWWQVSFNVIHTPYIWR